MLLILYFFMDFRHRMLPAVDSHAASYSNHRIEIMMTFFKTFVSMIEIYSVYKYVCAVSPLLSGSKLQVERCSVANSP